MGNRTSSELMAPASEISTYFRCNNCSVVIIQCTWKRCKTCKLFDLCDNCAKLTNDGLPSATRLHHAKLHTDMNKSLPVNNDDMETIWVENASNYDNDVISQINNSEFNRIVANKKVQNDYDLSMILSVAPELERTPIEALKKLDKPQLNSIIADYYTEAYKRKIRILCLDGGGIRGYMPIRVLSHLIATRYLPGIDIDQSNNKDEKFKQQFKDAQIQLTNQFDYFAGTSTGGLIAFCLAVNYNILDLKEIYSRAPYYFKKNHILGPIFKARYNHSRIHAKIDHIINNITLKNGKQLTAENATLLDIRNYLNPDNMIDENQPHLHGNIIEFSDDKITSTNGDHTEFAINLRPVPRERILLITAYNTTKSQMTVFNTSYPPHWSYRIADVLKATMAAPTYFQPWQIQKGTLVNGKFQGEEEAAEQFIDGGVFANDPELVALWAIRMQWKKPANYYLLSIGTGCYHSAPSTTSSWGGVYSWIFGKPFVIDALMDATRSMTETVMSNLSKFYDMRRMKFNYRITKPMKLDDQNFITQFDNEWKTLKEGPDFQSMVYFYNRFIDPVQNQFEN